ncbi:wall-associated receptor kinase-like 18 [Oryza glaberrima]|uniref:wall-associated receptor kinase-like 18 n=1 Tax=Oryza glaberrima TaxID=4538 RepID=UPI00224C2698|nr:wall-associated receptor kinase-like 18 [Oryza glaberrima]
MDLSENKHKESIEREKWIEDSISNIKPFTEEDIKRITSDYSTSLGNGKFGKVYRGVLDGNRYVAVKKYIHMDSEQEFAKEVIVHSQINHKNVVKLIGYCIEKNALMMVMEHMSNGDLDYHLHVKNSLDSLDARLNIAIECADALGYLHSMCSPVLHGDVKPSNILLGDNFIAKISDFGISRLLSIDKTHTENLIGSIGYMDPLYYREGRLTPKSDVYSLGIVLLELITKKRVTSLTQALAEGKGVTELLDPKIANESNMKVLVEIEKLVKECLTEDILRRPDMCDVAGHLRMLRKFCLRQPAPLENFVWHVFPETHNEVKQQSQQGTNNVRSSSMVFPKMAGIFNWNMYRSRKKGAPLYISGKRMFTIREIKAMTDNYSTIIGRSAITASYLGILRDGRKVVVKKHIKGIEHGEDGNANELNLPELIHKNIIQLLGFCCELDTVILVQEFANKGSLDNILHGTRNPLPLYLRLDIAIGSADGLTYMHSRSKPILHGDVRTYRILLDDNIVPKISYFGSSQIGEDDKNKWAVAVDKNYIDPAYKETGIFTRKSDVYSFGVVLLELITRKRSKKCSLVVDYFNVYKKENSGRIMFDNKITADENIATLEAIGILAMRCLSYDVDERPEMREVAEQLAMLKIARKQGRTQTQGKLRTTMKGP